MRQQQMQMKLAEMQAEMQKTQEELEAKEFRATAGGGAVTAVVSGKKELVSLTIQPEAMDPEDLEMLQDMVISAVNGALHQAEDSMEQGMSALTGGLNLGAFGL